MQPKLIVTSSQHPDMDGLACAYAYSEFLNKTGRPARCTIFGKMRTEADFAAKKFGIKIQRGEKTINENNQIILVDTSIASRIHKKIKPEQVVEIIDHRKFNTIESFPNAKVQIELVGAAATMIAEKFKQNKISITSQSARLLLYAIISNTINFKNNVTTDRDRKAANWLKSHIDVEKNYIEDFFVAKSKIANLKKEIESDGSVFDFNGKKVYIAQLEIVDAMNFISKNEKEISSILYKLGRKNKINNSFLKAIDIIKARNIFYSESSGVKKALSDILKIKFKGNTASSRGIIMRKELSPMFDEYYRKKM